jgi:hypothetical protein
MKKIFIHLTGYTIGTALVMNIAKLEILSRLGSASYLGMLSIVVIAVVLVTDIPFSYIFDNTSRRTSAFLAGLCSTLFCLIIIGLNEQTILYLAILLGLANSLMSGVAGAMLMEIEDQSDRRLKAMSMLDLCLMSSALLANLVGIWLYFAYEGLVWILAGSITFSSTAMTYALLPPNRTKGERFDHKKLLKSALFVTILKQSKNFEIFCLGALCIGLIQAIHTFWLIYFAESLDQIDSLLFIALTSSFMLLTQAGAGALGSSLHKKHLKTTIIVLSFSLLAMSWSIANSAWIYMPLLGATMIVGTLLQRNVYVFVQDHIGDEQRSFASSIMSILGSIVGILVIFTLNQIVDEHGMLAIVFLFTSTAVIAMWLTIKPANQILWS